jgi:hypothetical protein
VTARQHYPILLTPTLSSKRRGSTKVASSERKGSREDSLSLERERARVRVR